MTRVWTTGALWFLAALAAVVALVLATQSCASLSAYERAHPDTVAKAVAAVELANCVDVAVSKYQAQQASQAIAALDAGAPPAPLPNPYETTPPPEPSAQ